MISFTARSDCKELLDGDNLPFEAIRKNMEELDKINNWLGGHRVTLEGIKKITAGERRNWSICEIGCGGADNLRAVRKWSQQNGMACSFTGIDINEACINFAEQHPHNKDIRFIRSDYRDVQFEEKPDIIFSSLFCHHFTDRELAEQINWMKEQSNLGFFINDLHRHPLAYYSIRLLTSIFSGSAFVKNDAPISVLRGFKKKDWLRVFEQAGIINFNCSWHWAFRWLVTYQHEGRI